MAAKRVTHPAHREHQQTYRERQRAAGLTEVNEWVPAAQREFYRAIAKALREGAPVTIGRVRTADEERQDQVLSLTLFRQILSE